MNIIDAPQGSPEWLAIRAKHFTASEAPAMMGASKYQTRSELLDQKATGIAKDVDANTQRLFDRGHAAEAAARPIVERIIGAELFPATVALEVDGLPLLASFDGLTMMDDTAWENKLFNAALADSVRAGQLEPHYYWQLEQQLLVSGAERVYFTTSDGTPENTVGVWYVSEPERRAALIAGWKQFAEDLKTHTPAVKVAAPVASVIEELPALVAQVEGRVLSTNLDAFKAKALDFIGKIKTELVSDQDFADADRMTGFLKDGEEKLALAKSQALAQTASIDELFRTIDAISAEMRTKRLALERLVKAEKENRKADIVSEAADAMILHVKKLNERIGGNWMPGTIMASARFAESIKGLKSLDSMRDKVATALAQAKIEANEIADLIERNHKALEAVGSDCVLAPDFSAICTKPAEDFDNLIAARLAEMKEAEAKRAAAEQAKNAQKQAAATVVAANDQRGNAADATHAQPTATAAPQAPAASTSPIPLTEQIASFFASVGTPASKQANYRAVIMAWEDFKAGAMKEAA